MLNCVKMIRYVGRLFKNLLQHWSKVVYRRIFFSFLLLFIFIIFVCTYYWVLLFFFTFSLNFFLSAFFSIQFWNILFLINWSFIIFRKIIFISYHFIFFTKSIFETEKKVVFLENMKFPFPFFFKLKNLEDT